MADRVGLSCRDGDGRELIEQRGIQAHQPCQSQIERFGPISQSSSHDTQHRSCIV